MKNLIQFLLFITLMTKINTFDEEYFKSIKSNDFLEIYSDFEKTDNEINDYYYNLYFSMFPEDMNTSQQSQIGLKEFLQNDLSQYEIENPKKTFLSEIENSFKKHSNFKDKYLEESMIHNFSNDLKIIHRDFFLRLLNKKIQNNKIDFKHEKKEINSLINKLILELKESYYKEKPVQYENFSKELLARVDLICSNEIILSSKIENYYELRKNHFERILYEIYNLINFIPVEKNENLKLILKRIDDLIIIEISLQKDKSILNELFDLIYNYIETKRKQILFLDSETDYWFIKTIKIVLEKKNTFFNKKQAFLNQLNFFKNNIERDISPFFTLFITNFSLNLNKDIFKNFFGRSFNQKMILYMYEMDMMLYMKNKNSDIFNGYFYDHLLTDFDELSFLDNYYIDSNNYFLPFLAYDIDLKNNILFYNYFYMIFLQFRLFSSKFNKNVIWINYITQFDNYLNKLLKSEKNLEKRVFILIIKTINLDINLREFNYTIIYPDLNIIEIKRIYQFLKKTDSKKIKNLLNEIFEIRSPGQYEKDYIEAHYVGYLSELNFNSGVLKRNKIIFNDDKKKALNRSESHLVRLKSKTDFEFLNFEDIQTYSVFEFLVNSDTIDFGLIEDFEEHHKIDRLGKFDFSEDQNLADMKKFYKTDINLKKAENFIAKDQDVDDRKELQSIFKSFREENNYLGTLEILLGIVILFL